MLKTTICLNIFSQIWSKNIFNFKLITRSINRNVPISACHLAVSCKIYLRFFHSPIIRFGLNLHYVWIWIHLKLKKKLNLNFWNRWNWLFEFQFLILENVEIEFSIYCEEITAGFNCILQLSCKWQQVPCKEAPSTCKTVQNDVGLDFN